ncbi:MAG: hypothetical protein KZQ89_08710 [Candidatus Thiodiazotropha sp. (ex Lucinoma kastoroae)]|nr:hypothetical protein [Candidatus Thiodiazotropha sp. (ex Lucinoma kastoroae)]MCU7860264.1 hypothetical protein [Candidatus Thiodiazotropha sp. (ex Lucinoma kastoroae)]
MKYNKIVSLLIIASAFGVVPVNAEENAMSFFVTSIGSGKGGDLGGLKGADAHCQKLATAVGADKRQWRAYLSTEEAGKRGISARDRIGKGPWYNAKGVLIAENITELHLFNKTILKETAVTEKGETVNGRGDKPNQHDILTGSMNDGTAYFPDDADHTCNNWTSSDTGSAQVGHHDRHGGGNLSWTSAHGSRDCSIDGLSKTGGSGLFYCFAAD